MNGVAETAAGPKLMSANSTRLMRSGDSAAATRYGIAVFGCSNEIDRRLGCC